jgi:hypothetical protein
MAVISKSIRRFNEFGGWLLFFAYLKMGTLLPDTRALLYCIKEGREFKTAYPEMIGTVEKILAKKYGYILNDALKDFSSDENNDKPVPKIVWTCWLQGMENAPYMVKYCIGSQKKALPDYEHRILTLENYHQWVELPEYFEKKFQKGRIPRALFTDLLRLAVLKKYGGVWLDTSVLCTGFENEKLSNRWQRIERSEFTIFRYFQRGKKEPVGLSNWFIAAHPNDFVVSTVLDMLLAYWKDYNCTVDYYIMHLFITMCLNAVPSIAESMPRENSYHSIMLNSVLAKDYNEDWWNDVKAHVFLHKLNYRKADEASRNPRSFDNAIFKQK